MSAPNTKKRSETNWAYIDSLSDDDIDTSDIPPLSEEMLARATIRLPKQLAVTVHVDPDVLAWYQEQGDQWEARMRAALRIYVSAHRELPDLSSPSPEQGMD